MISILSDKFKIKCDTSGCKNRAVYKITLKPRLSLTSGIYMCKECAKTTYEELGTLFVPKSPENIMRKRERGKIG